MPLDLAYDLSNFTPADAAPLQANFTRVEQYTNQEVVTRDGTTAMTAQLKLVGNPVAPLDAAAKQYVDLLLPIGVILPFGGAAVPGAGIWAIANGVSLATAAYPDLFAVYSYTYGGSAGNFNLPNFIDRVPMGASTTKPLGSTGGNANATLVSHNHNVRHDHTASANNADTNHSHLMAQHDHRGTTDGGGFHTHNLGAGALLYYVQFGGGASEGTPGPGSAARSSPWTDGPNHVHGFTTGLGGATKTSYQSESSVVDGGDRYAHNHTITVNSNDFNTTTDGSAATDANLPPYVALNWICRVG